MPEKELERQNRERAAALVALMVLHFGKVRVAVLIEEWEGECAKHGWKSPVVMDLIEG